MKGENQMNQSQSVLDCITVLYDQLFDAEKKIAKFILNNPKKVVDMTVSGLAEISECLLRLYQDFVVRWV